jgi:D-amino-acid dehydrogenase
MAMRNLFDRKAPFRWRPDFTLAQLRWLKVMAGQCDAAHFAVNRRRMLALGIYSRDRLSEVEQATGITFERSRAGVLQLCQSAIQQSMVQQQAAALKAQGFDAEWLDREQTVCLEPALARGAPALVGALCLRDEGSGRCEDFTARLVEW